MIEKLTEVDCVLPDVELPTMGRFIAVFISHGSEAYWNCTSPAATSAGAEYLARNRYACSGTVRVFEVPEEPQ